MKEKKKKVREEKRKEKEQLVKEKQERKEKKQLSKGWHVKQRSVGIHLQQSGSNASPVMDGSTVCAMVSNPRMLVPASSTVQLALKPIFS